MSPLVRRLRGNSRKSSLYARKYDRIKLWQNRPKCGSNCRSKGYLTATYKAQLRGRYMGRFENPLPVEFIFQDRLLFDPAVQKMRDRPGGIPPQNLRGSLNASIPKSVQVADDLFYENLYRLQEGLPPIPRKNNEPLRKLSLPETLRGSRALHRPQDHEHTRDPSPANPAAD